jgi:hypothetical protein
VDVDDVDEVDPGEEVDAEEPDDVDDVEAEPEAEVGVVDEDDAGTAPATPGSMLGRVMTTPAMRTVAITPTNGTRRRKTRAPVLTRREASVDPGASGSLGARAVVLSDLTVRTCVMIVAR